jgi:hypothetical protein
MIMGYKGITAINGRKPGQERHASNEAVGKVNFSNF